MLTRRTCAAVGVILGGLVLSLRGVPAQDLATDSKLVSLDVQDASLVDVVRMLSRMSGANILIKPGVETPVNVAINDVPLSTMLELIVEVSGFSLEKREPNIYIIGPPKEKAAPSPKGPEEVKVTVVQAGQEEPPVEVKPVRQGTAAARQREDEVISPGPPVTRPAPRIARGGSRWRAPGADEMIWKTIPVRYIAASEAARMMGGEAWEGDFGLFPQGLISSRVQLPGQRRGERQFAAPTNYPVREQIGGGFGGGRGGGFGGGGLGGGFGGGGLGGGYGGGGLGGGFGGGGLGGGFGGGGLGGGVGGGGFLGGYAGEIEGLDTLIGYDALNALIVRGSEDAIQEVMEILQLIDVPPKQIQIETRYVTLTTNKANDLGISWAVSNGELATSSQSSVAGTHALRYAVGNFTATIEALIRESKGKVINAPTVVIQNGQIGAIGVFQDRPFFIPNISTNQFGIREVQYEVQSFQAGTFLFVLARITGVPPNESITFTLMPQVSDFAGEVVSPDGQRLPIQIQQTIQTTLRVKDGETIAMGGLMRKDNVESEEKVPLLGDLPWLGPLLFRNRTHSNQTSELLIFVTPTIIRDPETEAVAEQARPRVAP